MLIILMVAFANKMDEAHLNEEGLKGLQKMKQGQKDLTKEADYVAHLKEHAQKIPPKEKPITEQANSLNPRTYAAAIPIENTKAYNEKVYTAETRRIVLVEIFGTTTCPWCVKAKKLTEKLKVPYEYLNINENFVRRRSQLLLNKIGSTHDTIPQIFIIDNQNTRWFVGGFAEFKAFAKRHMPLPLNLPK